MGKIRPHSGPGPGTSTKFFVTIDFDGTVTDTDITDAVIKEFARPEWEEAERLWEAGAIGSKECLSTQMSLIDSPLDRLVAYAGGFAVHESFIGFVNFLREFHIPFAVISDGFRVFIEKLLEKAGAPDIPVYANRIKEEGGRLKTLFPYSSATCPSGTCKCTTAEKLSDQLPLIHIGDGRSDFCLAEKAAYVFSKRKLTDHCASMGIPHSAFDDFITVEKRLKALLNHAVTPGVIHTCHEHRERERSLWNIAS